MSPHSTAPPAKPSEQPTADGTDRSRAYKSRNKRPCDFCRYKKAACHLESKPPCELCIRYNKQCTFVESPAKRRRPNDSATDINPHNGDGMFKRLSNVSVDHSPSFGHDRLPGIDIGNDTLPWENDINPFGINGMETMSSTMAPNFAFDPALYQEPMAFETFEPISASTTADTLGYRFPSHHRHSSSMETSTPQSQSAFSPVNLQLPFDSTTGEPSLDRQTSSNAQIVGLSGESDPYLLSKYRYDVYNEAAFQSIRVRKMSGGPTDEEHDIPTFFQFQHNALVSRAQPREKTDTNERWRRELEELVNEETGKRLINLFYRYVQPYFPILSRENGDGDGREAREMPPCVLAAIYGHALPFCAWDEKLCVEVYTPPSADVLFKIAWMSCQPLLHTPTMAVLQTLLLLVQRRPTIRHVSDTPFKWVIMTTAVSIAQALGIDRDPTDWPIPSWEIQQRKRLAWAVYVQDKWLALNFGRSSHIQADDFDVPPLTENDFPEADRRYDDDASSAHFPIHHFLQLCRLTTIVDDILHNLFSIRATRRLHTSLEATLEVAKPLRIRLTEWYQSLPPGLLPNHPSSTGTPATAARRIPSPATSESPGRPLTAKTTTMATTTITTTIFTPRSSESASATAPLDLDGHGSLQLAYITAKIELFRAMLRPEVTDANAAAVTALRTGALAVAKEMCEFLEGLNARELEAFWASYSRTNFTIGSSFMLLLFVTAPTVADARECLGLLNAWRAGLRVKSRSCDLLNLALLRLDGVFVAGMEGVVELSDAAGVAWAEAGGGGGGGSGRV